MSLTPGTRLGVYDVVAPIGEGGMGQVFRARDTRLNRDVALKVLPDSFAHDPERLARFTREAQTLAALNHPNIAHIHGLEVSDGVRALVMELVEGEDLACRVARGPLDVDEAVAVAKQIADALDAAHQQGIVHRDLKPANVKVRADGTVKVLDFGLAKAMEPRDPSSGEVMQSPTITTPAMTRAGVILGTAAYMAPEQARGKGADERADIWAFGCVLYEMLTGTRAFAGEDITDVLAAVVRDEPDWSRLPADTPAAIRRLLRRALKKDRRQRLADIADARLDLDDAVSEAPPIERGQTAVAQRSRRARMWAIGAVAAVLIAAVSSVPAMRQWLRPPASDVRIVHFDVSPPAQSNLDWGQPLSPDGRTLAFIARSDGKPQIWIRPLDSDEARVLPGTDGATRSFWSPDSQRVAFFVDGNLKEVGIDGSGPRLIAQGPFRDGAWNADGVLLLGGQLGRPLMRVSQRGGEPVAETALDQSAGEVSHDYPEFLPDGRHYVYLTRRGVRTDDLNTYVGELGSRQRRELPGIRSATKYSPSGHLLFLRGTTLMAQAFSIERLELTGDAFPIAERVAGNRVATFSVSREGTLAFIGGDAPESQLTWFDRAGTRLGTFGPVGVYGDVALSPDGRSVAFDRGSPGDLWLLDSVRLASARITAERADDRQPVWSPTGQTIAFTSNRAGGDAVYERRSGVGGNERLLFQSAVPLMLSDWSRDGKYLTYAAGGDVWALPLADARKPLQVTTSTNFQEQRAVFSPDGRWIAYHSDASTGITRSGEGDIFIQPFPQGGAVLQVSTGGGFAPQWSGDGREIFYVASDGVLMAVPVTPRADTLDIGAPKPLFRPRFTDTPLANARYNVSRDGEFLVREGASARSVTVILNFFEQLKRAAAN